MLFAVARSRPGNQRASTTRIMVHTPPSISPSRKRRMRSSVPFCAKPVRSDAVCRRALTSRKPAGEHNEDHGPYAAINQPQQEAEDEEFRAVLREAGPI